MGLRRASIGALILCAAVPFLATCSGGSSSSGAGPSLELFAGSAIGAGFTDGTGAAARFRSPIGVAADSAGNLYVADTANHLIRKIAPGGSVSTLAGAAGQSGDADGDGASARFNFPEGIATDGTGNVYVADSENHTIRKIAPNGVVSTLAGSAGMPGSADGNGSSARFNHPMGVAADGAGNVYVADTLNGAIRKIDSSGDTSTFVGAPIALFPEGVATDSAGNVYIADGLRVVRKVAPDGTVTTLAGTVGLTGSDDGTGADARFGLPAGIAVGGNNNVYVGDSSNNTIRMITPAGVVTTLAGSAGVTGSADGTSANASFDFPFGVAVFGGDIYVADVSNNTIRRIAPGGVVSTYAGTPRARGSADGTGTQARFDMPSAIVADPAGNLYVADFGNHTVRRITPAAVVATFAGTAGAFGSLDGTGTASRFNHPDGIAIDSAGNLYVGDADNNTIRKISAAGEVSTLAGLAGAPGSDDGAGSTARFDFPTGLAVDTAGNVYVADSANHTIRKITPGGVVTTLAGSAGISGTDDGVGAAARFNNPFGVAVDSAGNVYIADTFNHTIRKIATDGTVTTLAGAGGVLGSDDGIGAAARFDLPAGLAIDSAGSLYVADFNNNTVRKVLPSGEVTTVVGVAGPGVFTPGNLPGRLASPIAVAISGSSLYIVLADGVAVVRNLL